MARNTHLVTNAQREARDRLVAAAPLVGSHRGVEEVHVDMNFTDPEGKGNPSPRAVSYMAEMHAYFQFNCPMRECTGGGFDPNEDLQRALAKGRTGHTGTLTCNGARPRSGFKDARCNLQLHYTLSLRGKAFAAA